MGRTKEFNIRYSPEFKLSVILDMREHGLGYCETARKHNVGAYPSIGKNYVKRWERIYLEEGETGFYIERRGRATKMENPNKGRPRKKPLDKSVEEDLIAENQRLREQVQDLQMQIEYTKKMSALVLAEEQKSGKRRK